MKYVFGLAALGVLVFGLTFAFDPAYQTMRQDRAQYEYNLQSLDLQKRELELREREAISGIVTGTNGGLHIVLFCAVVALLAMAMDAYNRRRVPLVRPDARGLLPVSRGSLERDEVVQLVMATLAAYHQTQAIAAAPASAVPHTLTYAPRITGGAVASGAASDVPPVPAADVPSFASLLASGRLGAGSPLLLGYSAGAPVTGSWRDIYSSAVAGLPSTGKTTTVRFLAAQAVLHGARFVVVDHHVEKADGLANTLAPLSSAFLCAPATDDASTLAALRLVDDVFESRRAGGKDRSVVLLCVDEFSALMRSKIGGEVAAIVEKLNQEGRGFGLFGLYSGQVWLASRSGGTELRYSLASSYVHRMHRGMARLLLPEGEGAKVERLPVGSALLWRPSGEVLPVDIPNTTADDVASVAALVWKPDGSQMVATVEQATTASQSARTASPDAVRVASLFLGGKTPADIVFELRGIRSSEGRRYQQALDEVLELLRAGIVS